ncbi:hypothetical protein G6F40_017214 [Rhizopus arrhizus]|nr:hypothetical protein G6F40_017214 [Rhizopus arrhizus]
MPAFHHLHDAALDEFGRRQPFDALAAVLDMALGDVAALALEQVRDGAQGRGLARAVGAQQRDDGALRHCQRNVLQCADIAPPAAPLPR